MESNIYMSGPQCKTGFLDNMIVELLLQNTVKHFFWTRPNFSKILLSDTRLL